MNAEARRRDSKTKRQSRIRSTKRGFVKKTIGGFRYKPRGDWFSFVKVRKLCFLCSCIQTLETSISQRHARIAATSYVICRNSFCVWQILYCPLYLLFVYHYSSIEMCIVVYESIGVIITVYMHVVPKFIRSQRDLQWLYRIAKIVQCVEDFGERQIFYKWKGSVQSQK